MIVRHARATLMALCLAGFAAGSAGAAGGTVYLQNDPGPSSVYVPQAGPAPASADPYVTQTPADARRVPAPRPAGASAKAAKAPVRRAAAAAAASEVGGGARAGFPSVGAGVQIVLRSPRLDDAFPSVGAGAVRR